MELQPGPLQVKSRSSCSQLSPQVRPSRPAVRPSGRPSVRPSVRPFVRPSMRLSVRPSIRLSVHPSARLSVRPSVPSVRHWCPSAVTSVRSSVSPYDYTTSPETSCLKIVLQVITFSVANPVICAQLKHYLDYFSVFGHLLSSCSSIRKNSVLILNEKGLRRR